MLRNNYYVFLLLLLINIVVGALGSKRFAASVMAVEAATT
jgi:hypothetical protein